MATEQEIREAYIFLRKNNNTISDETLNFMLGASLDRLKIETVSSNLILLDQIKKSISNNFDQNGDLDEDELTNDIFNIVLNVVQNLENYVR